MGTSTVVSCTPVEDEARFTIQDCLETEKGRESYEWAEALLERGRLSKRAWVNALNLVSDTYSRDAFYQDWSPSKRYRIVSCQYFSEANDAIDFVFDTDGLGLARISTQQRGGEIAVLSFTLLQDLLLE